jgi:uncharacterized protein (UPF0335 family)
MRCHVTGRAPQSSPDMQKIIERLDKLEDENQKLLDEIPPTAQ